jgi:hypothetical protein
MADYDPTLPQYIRSERNRMKLLYEGNSHTIHRVVGNKITWRCDLKSKKCKGRWRQTDDDIFDCITAHSHGPSHELCEKEMIQSTIREKSANTTETSRSLYADAVQKRSAGAIARLPPYAFIQRSIARKRKVGNLPHPVPTSLADVNIPDDLQFTANGNYFVLHDSGADDVDRIIMLTTIGNIETLRECTVYLADATFKVAPTLFYQLWVIHGLYKNAVLPMIYCVMPNKSTEMYNKCLDQITNFGLAPDIIITDFERAEINSLNRSFPNAQVHGCFFHYAQCIWRKLQDIKWAAKCQHDVEFAMDIKLFIALAFVRVADVNETYDDLLASFNGKYTDTFDTVDTQKADEFFTYFEATWIGSLMRNNQRRQPLYAHAMWNCYEQTVQNIPRTNNNIEAWNRVFQETVGIHHPQIYRLIKEIIKEQGLTESKIARLLGGEDVSLYSNAIYRATNQHIQNIIDDYDQRTSIDYCRAIAYNFNL